MWNLLLLAWCAFQCGFPQVSCRSTHVRKLIDPKSYEKSYNRHTPILEAVKANQSAAEDKFSKDLDLNSVEGYMGVELSESVEELVHGIRLFEPLPVPEHYTLAPPRNTSDLLAGEYRELHKGRWVTIVNPDEPGGEQLLWVPNDGMFASSHLDGREFTKPAAVPYVLKDPESAEPLKFGEYKERSRGRFVQIGSEPGEFGKQILWVPHIVTEGTRLLDYDSHQEYHSSSSHVSQSDRMLHKRYILPTTSRRDHWGSYFTKIMDIPCRVARLITGADCENAEPSQSQKQTKLHVTRTNVSDEGATEPRRAINSPVHGSEPTEIYLEVKNPAARGHYYHNPGKRKDVADLGNFVDPFW